MEWKKWQGSNWCWGSALTIHTSPGLRVGRVAAVIPRCLQPKAGLHPAQVATLSQNHKDTTVHTRTHWYRQFRVPSCLCLWTMGGSRRTWRELCTIQWTTVQCRAQSHCTVHNVSKEQSIIFYSVWKLHTEGQKIELCNLPAVRRRCWPQRRLKTSSFSLQDVVE